MRLFKTKQFARFAAREGIADPALRDAVRRAESGLIDAGPGGGVIKQRPRTAGSGKSGVFASFAYGYAKNDRDNIGRDQLKAFRFAGKALTAALRNGTITEIE